MLSKEPKFDQEMYANSGCKCITGYDPSEHVYAYWQCQKLYLDLHMMVIHPDYNEKDLPLRRVFGIESRFQRVQVQ